MVIKGNMRDPGGDENPLYFDCKCINTLVLILFCSFARCYY